ncbi:PREDICTED: selenocysteine-specific elongation factor, partial [Tinamus guttatus]|uniref:selenocysteine-specific elongation factor n=1 Tax=Tinamus guttatus TaxID=94827 RepID=UPI00052EB2EE
MPPNTAPAPARGEAAAALALGETVNERSLPCDFCRGILWVPEFLTGSAVPFLPAVLPCTRVCACLCFSRIHFKPLLPLRGRAQIIDLMMLVIDVTKGMQTQSAECLVIGQIACQKMVVVLNKIDLLPEGKRQSAIEKMTKKMQKTLENTKFCGCPIVAVAAKPGGPEAPESETPIGVSELIEVLKSQAYLPSRDPSGHFLMAVDHCFSIKGQGTVMTGTILSGSVSLGDNVEIPALKVTKKVKSMQMFHTPVTYAMQGDRVGVCVTQFDPKLLERGLICTPESLHTIHAAIISLKKIQYFRGPLQTKAKFHITVGHETVMGRVMFFGPAPADFNEEIQENVFNFEKDYLYQEEYLSKDSKTSEENKENDQAEVQLPRQQWALLEFEKPVACPKLCLVIGSKLDTDIHANTCRLAFHGVLLQGMEDKNYAETSLPRLKVYKLKHKEGQVERVMDDYSVIGRSLFKKETNIQIFVGLKVKLSTGEDGVIEGGFGQSGKFKIRIPASTFMMKDDASSLSVQDEAMPPLLPLSSLSTELAGPNAAAGLGTRSGCAGGLPLRHRRCFRGVALREERESFEPRNCNDSAAKSGPAVGAASGYLVTVTEPAVDQVTLN